MKISEAQKKVKEFTTNQLGVDAQEAFKKASEEISRKYSNKGEKRGTA